VNLQLPLDPVARCTKPSWCSVVVDVCVLCACSCCCCCAGLDFGSLLVLLVEKLRRSCCAAVVIVAHTHRDRMLWSGYTGSLLLNQGVGIFGLCSLCLWQQGRIVCKDSVLQCAAATYAEMIIATCKCLPVPTVVLYQHKVGQLAEVSDGGRCMLQLRTISAINLLTEPVRTSARTVAVVTVAKSGFSLGLGVPTTVDLEQSLA